MENKKEYVVIREMADSGGSHDYYIVGLFDSLDLAKERVTNLEVTETFRNDTIFTILELKGETDA